MTAWRVRGTQLPDGVDAEWWIDGDVLLDRPADDAQDLPGRFVLPGLVDAHCHLTLAEADRGPMPAGDDEIARRLTAWPRDGVLAIRDTGAHDDTSVRLSLSADGAVDAVACGRFLSSPGNYFPGVFDGVPAEALVEAALAEVAAGATWVKLVADFPPGADLSKQPEPTYDVSAVQRLVEAVHAAGARVAAHVTTSLVRELVDAGIDSVEHGTALDEQTLRVMAERGIAWTPTLSAVLFPPGPNDPPERAARQAARAELMCTLLPIAQRLGVIVLTGSDVVGTVAGEVAQLARHGLDPVAAIAAATSAARDYLGLAPLEVGAAADLVTYDDDPRDDPEVLARPVAVVRRGTRIR